MKIECENLGLKLISNDDLPAFSVERRIINTNISPDKYSISSWEDLPTNDNWSMTYKDHEYTASEIEMKSPKERNQLDIIKDKIIVLKPNGNSDTFETWTEILDGKDQTKRLAVIDYLEPSNVELSNNSIKFEGAHSKSSFSSTSHSLALYRRNESSSIITDIHDEIQTDMLVPQTRYSRETSTTIAVRNQIPVINLGGT